MAKQDWLEQQLAQAEPHIADNGFSAQVILRLPSARLRRLHVTDHLGQRYTLVATALGAAALCYWLPLGEWSQALLHLSQQPAQSTTFLASLGLGWAASLAACFWALSAKV